MAPKRVIAHLDCDAFYATVELLRRPELVGKPVIVAGSGPRAVVTTASYEAREFGVGSAMPASRARRLCPDAIVIPPDFAAYRETSKRVWEVIGERLDRVQQIGIDEAYAELTGVEKPLRVLREVVAAVKEETGIVISVGVGPSRLVAKCCSDLGKPRRLRRDGPRGGVRPLRDRADQPRARHRPEDGRTARGDRLPHARSAPAGRRGQARRALRHQHRALPESPRVSSRTTRRSRPRRRSPSRTRPSARSTWTSRSSSELEDYLREMSREVCEGLQKRGRRGRTIAIKVRLDDWTTVTRARTVEAPTNETQLVIDTALELLRAYAPPRPVRLLGVRLAGFEDVEPDVRRAPPAPVGQLALEL